MICPSLAFQLKYLLAVELQKLPPHCRHAHLCAMSLLALTSQPPAAQLLPYPAAPTPPRSAPPTLPSPLPCTRTVGSLKDPTKTECPQITKFCSRESQQLGLSAAAPHGLSARPLQQYIEETVLCSDSHFIIRQ